MYSGYTTSSTLAIGLYTQAENEMWKSSTTKQYWNVRVPAVIGSCNLVVKALVAQASDLGSISGDFPVLFYILLLTCVSDVNRISSKGVLSMRTQSVHAKF